MKNYFFKSSFNLTAMKISSIQILLLISKNYKKAKKDEKILNK